MRLHGRPFFQQNGRMGNAAGLFRQLDLEFHFTVDLCATPENAKCAAFFSRADNGLVQTWTGTCWLNSPVKKSRFDQATSDAAAMISAAPSASNTARIMTVIASAV